MKASDLYNERTLIESWGKSKTFESCRRMREVMPGFPQYLDNVSEYDAGNLIYLMSKTGKTSTRKAFVDAILCSRDLKCGDERFTIWLGELLINPERIKNEIQTIWVYEDANLVHVTFNDKIKIFQGPTVAKQVSRLTQLSKQFLYDFSVKLKATLVSEASNIIFEYDGPEDEENECIK